jgi:protein SCO1/2
VNYLIMAIVVAFAVNSARADLPNDSVYHFDSTWETQRGEQVQLSQLQGKIRLVAFVYTYCEHTCPTIVAQLKSVQSQLNPQAAAQTQVTLVSLDPERDTPQQLAAYMREHKLDEAGWLMLHGSAKDVRTLAVLFGVRYQPMGESDIAHSNMITVLNTEGVISYQMKGLSDDLQQVVSATEALVPHD